MLPTSEQLQIREAAQQFAQERLKPFAAEWDKQHRFPREAINEMASLGFFGMLVPEEWGGCDTGYLAYAMALEEIAAGDGTLSRFLRQEGIQVRATDNYSWHDRISFPADVERLEAIAAIRKYAPEVVLCSWPPSQNNFEREVFQTASVRIYLVVVSIHHFASGNWSDYASQQSFAMEHRPDLARLLLPPELGCDVLLFRRNGSRAESSRGEHD